MERTADNKTFEFTPGQKQLIKTIEGNFEKGKKHQTVYIPYGYGKTRICTRIAENLASKGKTVLLCFPKGILAVQAQSLISGYDKQISVCSIDEIIRYQGLPFNFVFYVSDVIKGFQHNVQKVLESDSLENAIEQIKNTERELLSPEQRDLMFAYCLNKIVESSRAQTLFFDFPDNVKDINCSGFDYFPVITSESWIKQKNTVQGNEEFVSLNLVSVDKLSEIIRTANDESIQKYCAALLKELMKISSSQEIIQDKIDELGLKINTLTEQVSCCQSLIKKQLKATEDEAEKERLISVFVDECVDRIGQHLGQNLIEDENKAEAELVGDLGEEVWGKLESDSKNFLITSTLIFNKYPSKENFDYSAVCLPIVKTLELELKKRFYFDFCVHLDNDPAIKGRQDYPYGLLTASGKKRRESDFTLGSIAYLFGMKKPCNMSAEKQKEDYEKLIDFCQRNLFKSSDRTEISKHISTWAEQIEEIKSQYRDEFAHTGILKAEQARKCREWVIVSRKLLRVMMESFKY